MESSAESSVESLRWVSALSEIVQEDSTDDSAEALIDDSLRDFRSGHSRKSRRREESRTFFSCFLMFFVQNLSKSVQKNRSKPVRPASTEISIQHDPTTITQK